MIILTYPQIPKQSKGFGILPLSTGVYLLNHIKKMDSYFSFNNFRVPHSINIIFYKLVQYFLERSYKMNKHIVSFSIIFLGICILLGCWFISQSIKPTQVVVTKEAQSRYELITRDDSTLIIFDKQNGEYWRKSINPDEGPWEKQTSPISTTSH